MLFFESTLVAALPDPQIRISNLSDTLMIRDFRRIDSHQDHSVRVLVKGTPLDDPRLF